MDKLRTGIIGAGGITALLHLPEIATNPEIEVSVLGGRKDDRLRQLCDQYDVPGWTKDYEAIISDSSLEAVIIATPHPHHVSWAIKAVEAGKHVLVQKPLCGQMDEAHAFVSAAERCDRTVLCMPHHGDYVYGLRQRCLDGDIGRISGARCRASHGGPEIYYAGVRETFGEAEDDLWFFDADKASVGALFDMGVYAVATLVGILGPAEQVTGMTATFDKPTPLEDSAVLVLRMQNGALVTAETGWCDPARTRELTIHGTSGKYTMPGSGDSELTRWTPTSYTDEQAPTAQEPLQFEKTIGNVHEHFLSCIRAGEQPLLSNVWAARHVTEILLAGLESARTGATISLETTDTYTP